MLNTTNKATAKKLTIKGEKFAEAMADPSTTSAQQAAIKAGYAPKTARNEAARLLTKVNIQARIEERKAEVAKNANVTKAQVLGATVLRAFATIDDVLDERGFFDIDKARETGAIHLIKKISRTKTQYGENISVELYSNETAQDKLGSYLGLEKLPFEPPTVEDVAMAVGERLRASGTWTEEEIELLLKDQYPELSKTDR